MKIFIGCSSGRQINEEYVEETRSIAKELGSKENELILMGSWESMNGSCYEEFVRNFRKVIVVMDENRKKIVNNMAEANPAILNSTFRCSESIYNKTDMLLFLPGGIGTMGILWSALKENCVKKTPKPIIIYNMNGYYNMMLTSLEQMMLECFEPEIIRNYYEVFCDREEMIEYINTYQIEKVLKK